MANVRGAKYRGREFWRVAVERMKQGENTGTLAKEVERLKRALAEKVLELDFFKGALHKIEARRRGEGSTGAKASTTRSGE